MNKLVLSQLSIEDLQIEFKKRKQGITIAAFIIGMMFGCAFCVLILRGITWYIFVPFVFVYWFRNAKPDYDEVKKEIKLRNLNGR